MLRDTWFWEVEVVRVQDGEQAGPARRLDFSVRLLNYLLGSLVAGGLAAAVLLAYVYFGPGDGFIGHRAIYCVMAEPNDVYYTHGHGCGGVAIVTEPEPRPSRVPDTTFLVRRLP